MELLTQLNPREDSEHCWEFKECKNLEEYIREYLNSNTQEEDILESAYQFVYDESNDWLRDQFTSIDVQNGFIVGALWMMNRLNNNK